MKISAGIGYDVHPLQEGRRLVLGGVEIPYEKGLSGHSDADVLIHAVCDALLGAAGEGDLGQHFPDTDPRYRDISSLHLLEQVLELIVRKGYRIMNLDTVVIAEQPRLSSFIPEIRSIMAKTLKLKDTDVNIKAKSNEGLGFLGRGEGIAAQAVTILSQESGG